MWAISNPSLVVFDSEMQLLIEMYVNSFMSSSVMRVWFYYSLDGNC